MLPVLAIPYFRFNPQVPAMSIDETSPAKLKELQSIGKAHVVSGHGRADCAALATLLLERKHSTKHAAALAAQRQLPLRLWPSALLAKLGSSVAALRRRSRL
jgi:hypothetical protein